MSVEPRHGPCCTVMSLEPITPGKPIDYGTLCVGYHCRWCGEPCGSHGHGCEWAERREERPDDEAAA